MRYTDRHLAGNWVWPFQRSRDAPGDRQASAGHPQAPPSHLCRQHRSLSTSHGDQDTGLRSVPSNPCPTTQATSSPSGCSTQRLPNRHPKHQKTSSHKHMHGDARTEQEIPPPGCNFPLHKRSLLAQGSGTL